MSLLGVIPLIVAWLLLAPAASAQGPVVDLRAGHPAGPQMDLASPRQVETAKPAVRRHRAPAEAVRVTPWPPVQGQTMTAWLQTDAVSLTLVFAGVRYPALVDGGFGWALVPVPALLEPGPHPLLLTSGASTMTLTIPVASGEFSTDVIPSSASDPILTDQAKVQAETRRTNQIFAGRTSEGWDPRSRFALPLEGEAPHTSPFGSRRTYGAGTAVSYHAGEDFSAIPGTPIYAPAAGEVVLAETLFVRGNAVIVDHGHGVFTGYWHMSALSVDAGDRVDPGQKIGEVGSTGLSTGAHLHWEMRVGGMAVDPMQWVR